MASNNKKNMFTGLKLLCIIMAVVFVIDGCRLFYITTVKGDEYSAKAESQQLSDTEIPAMRGSIYDSNGNILAQSATVWDVYLDPFNIKNDEVRSLIVDGLAEILKLDDEEQAELLKKSKKETRYVVVAQKVENDTKKQISDFIVANKKSKLSTIIGMTQTTKRYYPYGSFASSVLGFTSSDDKGLFGLEEYYDEELTGTNGRIITVKDAHSNKLPTDYETSIDAVDGNSIVLTINQNIQYYLEKDLRETMQEYNCEGAYGVVMNCKTGAVLGMASLPDFDCNAPRKLTYDKFTKALEKVTDKEQYELANSEYIQKQWSNFTVSNIYEPGSVFKTFMASAALEENVIGLNDTFNCTGLIKVADKTMHCHYHPGHGVQTFTQGLENSCNPFFITVGQKLGVHNYYKYFDAFGFTKKTNIDLPAEAKPDFYEEHEYGKVELASASFGQTNSLSPIQVCTGLCAIANGGTLLKPYIVGEIKDAQGNTISKTEPTEIRRVISEETSKKVCTMMKSVVDNGTGKNGYVAGYNVGGKTGTSTKLKETAEGGKTKYIVSFAAIAPADNPEIAMIIIIDEPNVDLGGGALCAPIAASVVEQAMTEMNIEPRYTDEEAKKLSKKTPNVVGKSVSSAKSALKSADLTCKVVGNGDKVISQAPSASSTIPSKGVVVVYTEKNKKKTVKVPDFTGLTISEANARAAESNLNLEIAGNNLSSSVVVAYKQSVDKGTSVSIGSVVTVTFKSTKAVLD